jgi:hypothetical protein
MGVSADVGVLGRWRDTKAEGSEEAACQPATRDTTGKRGLVCVSWDCV